MMIDATLLKKWFGEDLKSTSIRTLRSQAGLKQKEFDETLKLLLDEGVIYVVRYEHDEVGDQHPVEYAPTEKTLKLISELD